MGEGYPQCKIASHLSIGASAICHRVKKYNEIWDDIIVNGDQRKVISPNHASTVDRVRRAVLTLLGIDGEIKIGSIVEALASDNKEKLYTTKVFNAMTPKNEKRGRHANEGSNWKF